MFRCPEVDLLVKKCNDFDAGGVAVTIDGLALDLIMDLNKVLLKYAGFDGTEIVIPGPQKYMACALDPRGVDASLRYMKEENFKAIPAAVVTVEPRLVLN